MMAEMCIRDSRYAYSDELSVRDKIETIATRVYGAAAVEFSPQAKKQLQDIERLGFSSLPVCMAKTQYSLSEDVYKRQVSSCTPGRRWARDCSSTMGWA